MNLLSQKFLIVFFAIIFLGASGVVNAASLNINIGQESYAIDNEFVADIKIDSADVGINTAQATIKFSPTILEVVSLDKTNSVFNLWLQDPTFDNESGEISFIGGSSSGLIGKSLQVVRVVFKATGIGQSDLIFSDGAVTASDGSGTNVLSAMNKNTVIVENVTTTRPDVQTIERTPATSDITPIKPNIRVSLYPISSAWYNVSSRFTATWQLPADVSAVATSLDKNPTFIPTRSQGIFDNETFSALSDGVWYLHVRFCNNVGCGDTAHYRIAIDTVLPSEFEIKFSDGLSSDNPTPTISYIANDQLSGIDHYYVQIDASELVEVDTRSYVLPPQKPGKHSIKVGAQDRAGNKVENTAQFDILPIVSPKIFSTTTNVFVGEGGLFVNGSADLNLSITIDIVDEKDNIFYSFNTTPDEKGIWALKIDSPLKKGNYYVLATSHDKRGASSIPVKSDIVKVVDRPIITILGISITYSGLLIILLIVLVGSYIIGWYSNKLLNLQRRRLILISERDVSASFNVLKRDVQQAITNWDDGKIESHELTQVEFLLKHINENIEKLQKYIISGIKDIGKK